MDRFGRFLKYVFSHRFLEDVFSHLVALVLFALLGAGAAYLATKVVVYVINPTAISGLMANILLFVGFFVAGVLILLRLRRNRPLFDPIRPDFLIVRKEISMKYAARDQAVYKRKYRLKALKSDLDTFRDAYCWTGSKVTAIRASNTRHKIFETGTRGPYNLLSVNLGSPLNKGQETDVEITWELADAEKKAKPFVSTLVNEPTELLMMEVEIFKGGCYEDASFETSPTSSARGNIESRTEKIQNNTVRWEIKKPRLLHHYEIRWSGPEWQ